MACAFLVQLGQFHLQVRHLHLIYHSQDEQIADDIGGLPKENPLSGAVDSTYLSGRQISGAREDC